MAQHVGRTAWISSGLTKSRPASQAWARAQRSRAIEPRGLAPATHVGQLGSGEGWRAGGQSAGSGSVRPASPMYVPRISWRAANTSACQAGPLPAGCVSPARLAREPQDLALAGRSGIADAHVHQEAVELRFGQRVGAFLLDRVLRGHHQEQRRQRIGACGRR